MPSFKGFWEELMSEQGVENVFRTVKKEEVVAGPNYNVGDVIVGEIVEEGTL